MQIPARSHTRGLRVISSATVLMVAICKVFLFSLSYFFFLLCLSLHSPHQVGSKRAHADLHKAMHRHDNGDEGEEEDDEDDDSDDSDAADIGDDDEDEIDDGDDNNQKPPLVKKFRVGSEDEGTDLQCSVCRVYGKPFIPGKTPLAGVLPPPVMKKKGPKGPTKYKRKHMVQAKKVGIDEADHEDSSDNDKDGMQQQQQQQQQQEQQQPAPATTETKAFVNKCVFCGCQVHAICYLGTTDNSSHLDEDGDFVCDYCAGDYHSK